VDIIQSVGSVKGHNTAYMMQGVWVALTTTDDEHVETNFRTPCSTQAE
jgi:hypothetical protein